MRGAGKGALCPRSLAGWIHTDKDACMYMHTPVHRGTCRHPVYVCWQTALAEGGSSAVHIRSPPLGKPRGMPPPSPCPNRKYSLHCALWPQTIHAARASWLTKYVIYTKAALPAPIVLAIHPFFQPDPRGYILGHGATVADRDTHSPGPARDADPPGSSATCCHSTPRPRFALPHTPPATPATPRNTQHTHNKIRRSHHP